MDESSFLIVPAAGNSTRMGGVQSKILLEISGLSVLQHTLAALEACAWVTHIVIAARPAEQHELSRRLNKSPRVSIVQGGETRTESVRNGLRHLEQRFGSTMNQALVGVHDGARCLVNPGLVRRVFEAAREHGAALPALPVVDTVKQVDAQGVIERTVDRASLCMVQTPQVFKYELLRDGLNSNNTAVTDDASLIESQVRVHTVPGDPYNIKITRSEDLSLARTILETRRLDGWKDV